MDDTAVTACYDALLASIGNSAGAIGDRPVVTHWPHVGSAYHGLMIVGQAVYGWGDDFLAAHFRTQAGRDEGIAAFRAGLISRIRCTGSTPIPFGTHPFGALSV